MGLIDRNEGRRLFGSDPAAYDAARPGHAEQVYEVLVARCGLLAGTRVLEIGPGTGQATRRLLELGAQPVVAIEPDPALAAYLTAATDGVEIRASPLEEAVLEPAEFDLAAAASSFHWVEEAVGLAKVFGALRPGGWFAMWWTLFGDPDEPDAFIMETNPLLEGLDARQGRGRPKHALDLDARVRALEGAGFDEIRHDVFRWRASWDGNGIRALYGTFSPISRLDEARRTEILDEIARIARDDFDGRVERTLLTSLFTAQRPG